MTGSYLRKLGLPNELKLSCGIVGKRALQDTEARDVRSTVYRVHSSEPRVVAGTELALSNY